MKHLIVDRLAGQVSKIKVKHLLGKVVGSKIMRMVGKRGGRGGRDEEEKYWLTMAANSGR